MAFREIEGDEQGTFFKFESHGHALEGVYEGQHEADGKFGKQVVSIVRTTGEDAIAYSLTGWDVTSKLAKVEPGMAVRVTYVSDKDMGVDRQGQPKNPMKVFRVEVDDGPAPCRRL